MNKTVVGFTTIPSRFDKLDIVLDSLSNQSKKPDMIYLYVPTFYKRFQINPDISIVQSKIKKYDNVQIVQGIDYGPISKLFGSLLEENEPDSNIITCDDDCEYAEPWLENLVKEIEDNPHNPCGYRGRVFGQNLHYKNTTCISSKSFPVRTKVDLITAVRGWAYKRKFFDASYIENWEISAKQHPFIFFNDDIWISGIFQKNGISRIVFPCSSVWSKTEQLEDRLCKLSTQTPNTDQHIRLFEKYWRNPSC